jgi:pyrroloquinoline quinone (PQQ) biosynthesis protein C
MNIQQKIVEVFGKATTDFLSSPSLQELLSGKSTRAELLIFISNVFTTHYLSSHIVAFCFASLPSEASALLKENLSEEMGHADEEAHSVLLLKLAKGAGFTDSDIEQLIDESRQQIRTFCAINIPFPTLRDLCLSVLLETMSFEFMLSRCSSKIAKALSQHYALPEESLEWFDLHSEVDIRHAEEGLKIIQDFVMFHQIADAAFEHILGATFVKNVFLRKYFPTA